MTSDAWGVSFFGKKTTPKKKNSLKKERGSEMPGKHRTRMERGSIVAIDSCTKIRDMFGRYVIVIWKESPPSKRRALRKGKLGFAVWIMFHCLGTVLDILRINSTTKPAIARQPAEIRQPHP